MMKYIIWFLIMPIVIGIFSSSVFAHPWNTDGSGCHTCRTNCSSWWLSYGEYHCHNPKSYNTTPVYESCSSTYGWAAQETGNGTCGCMSGYEFWTDSFWKKSCVAKKTCSGVYGWNAVDNWGGKCVCMSWYQWNTSWTSCELKPTPMEACHASFWWNAVSTYDWKCTCMSWYQWNTSWTSCELKLTPIIPTCGLNSTYADGKCSCKVWYEWEDVNDTKNFDCKIKNICDTANGYQWTDGKCYCDNDYVLSTGDNKCIKNKISTDLTEKEKQLQSQVDKWFLKLQIKYANISDANEKKQKYENLRDSLYKYQWKLIGDKKFILEYLIFLVKKELGDTDLSLWDLFGY